MDLELLLIESGRRIEGKGREGPGEYREVRYEKKMERERRNKGERKYMCNLRRLLRHWRVHGRRLPVCDFPLKQCRYSGAFISLDQ